LILMKYPLTEWYTPPEFFNSMGVEFDLDPCSPGKQIVPGIRLAD
jgi:hypothetical protein